MKVYLNQKKAVLNRIRENHIFSITSLTNRRTAKQIKE